MRVEERSVDGKVKRIYIVTDAIKSLKMEEAQTSSHKYELTLARALGRYTDVIVLSTSLPIGTKWNDNQLELVGVKSSEGYQYEGLLNALSQYSNKDSAVLFWGYDLRKVWAILYIKYKLKYKCIAFQYDTHTCAISTLPRIKRMLVDVYFRIGMKLITLCDGFILFQDKAVDRLHVRRKRYLVSKPGVEEREIDRSFGRDKFVVAYCGSFTYLNGMHALIDSFELIKEENFEILICGDGPMLNEVLEAEQKYSFVHYRGLLNQEELESVYEKANVLLNLRITDDEAMDFAFPSKVFEYISLKIPLISTLVMEEREFVENVWVVESLNAEHVANAIKTVYHNFDLAEAKAERLARYIRDKYSNEEMTKRIYSFIESVVSNERSDG